MDFSEVLGLVKSLANRISASGFRPDYLVGLARGGWIPTRLLSDELGVKEILSVGLRYADTNRTTLVAYSLPSPMPNGKKLLLIEDCLESGRSLVEAKRLLEREKNFVQTASIFITDRTLERPDFFVHHLQLPPSFPWE
ncbi:phosphoribosyltransferase family protein [Caballeronia sp. LZ032]|uniref:phosphoribosyltransferase n=1 Tax=Caballeronia sp. LZ032 TaxID=3038565 RepID=UPI002864D1B3|nr:phosphoribosyltransferase family protein [Caballeronia sp. LZ032]MDR5878795.1 phosphoribosyltransferase family protein [Caballeronia sp. LZ032]